MKTILVPQGIFQDQGSSSQTGGGSGNPHGTFTAQIEADQSVTYRFHPLPASQTLNGTWDDFYMLGAKFGSYFQWAKKLAYSFTFVFPTLADIQACEAVELDLQSVLNGIVRNMGWQWRFSGGTVVSPVMSAFDYLNKKWVPQPQVVGWLPVPGVPITLRGEHLITSSGQQHLAFMFSDDENQHYAITRWNSQSVPNVYPGATDLSVAFQVDSRGQGTPFSLNVTNGKVEVE